MTQIICSCNAGAALLRFGLTRRREVAHPSKVAVAVGPLEFRLVRHEHGICPRPALAQRRQNKRTSAPCNACTLIYYFHVGGVPARFALDHVVLRCSLRSLCRTRSGAGVWRSPKTQHKALLSVVAESFFCARRYPRQTQDTQPAAYQPLVEQFERRAASVSNQPRKHARAHCRAGGTVLRTQVALASASRGSVCIMGPLQSSKMYACHNRDRPTGRHDEGAQLLANKPKSVARRAVTPRETT